MEFLYEMGREAIKNYGIAAFPIIILAIGNYLQWRTTKKKDLTIDGLRKEIVVQQDKKEKLNLKTLEVIHSSNARLEQEAIRKEYDSRALADNLNSLKDAIKNSCKCPSNGA